MINGEKVRNEWEKREYREMAEDKERG